MKPPESVAVVVAHPDDEVLGFGGCIARHAAKGDRVRILILATGLTSRGEADRSALEQLEDKARAAAMALGASEPEFGHFPDNRMDSVALLDVVKCVESFFEKNPPQLIFTHHPGDLNIDHRITAMAALTAARPLPGLAARLYAGEILSSSEYAAPSDRFIPNTYVNITGDALRKKRAALNCYKDELRAWPHPRSLEAQEHQARLRGSEAGFEAAEALLLIRAVHP